jgi:uncharacterized protein
MSRVSPKSASVRGTPVQIHGATLIALPDGALFWPVEGVLVVADLHLEKGSAFAARGQHLPPYDTAATLERMEMLIERHAPIRVLALGDSAHDRRAGERMAEQDSARLRRIVSATDWIWILGNHDPALPPAWGGTCLSEWRSGSLIFRHEAATTRPVKGEISGHFHPKACVRGEAARATRRCFVTDGRRLIMPAFGAYAGGLDALDPAIDRHFPDGFVALVLGADRVHPVSRGKLSPIGRAWGP